MKKELKAFTLIELLVVMVIMSVVAAVALPGFFSMGKGMSKRTAASNLHSTISLARQWAITHREKITFVFSANGLVYTNNQIEKAANSNAPACYYAISDDGVMVQSITDLPLGIGVGSFDPYIDTVKQLWGFTFKTDGGLTSENDYVIQIRQGHKLVNTFVFDDAAPSTITVNWLTGGISVE